MILTLIFKHKTNYMPDFKNNELNADSASKGLNNAPPELKAEPCQLEPQRQSFWKNIAASVFKAFNIEIKPKIGGWTFTWSKEKGTAVPLVLALTGIGVAA